MKRLFLSLFILFLIFCSTTVFAIPTTHFANLTTTPDVCQYAGTVTINGENAIDNNDEVGIFVDDGNGGELLVGAGIVGETQEGYYMINVYGDDTTTNGVKDGAEANDILTFKVWQKSTDTEVVITTDQMTAVTSGVDDGVEVPAIPPIFVNQLTYGYLNLAAVIGTGIVQSTEALVTSETQNQIVTLTASASDVAVSDNVEISLKYDCPDNTVTSLGITIHFDSTKLEYLNYSELFQISMLVLPQLQDDLNNTDSDDTTDKLIVLSYSDPIEGNWPNLDLPLFYLIKLQFKALEPASPTTVKVVKITGAANFGFVSTNADINITSPTQTTSAGTDNSPSFNISAESISGAPGDSIVIPINISNVATAFDSDAIGFSLQFDKTALEYVGIDTTGTLLNSFSLVDGKAKAGTLKVSGSYFENTASITDGLLLNLNFTIKSTATAGDSDLILLKFKDDLKAASTTNAKLTVSNTPSESTITSISSGTLYAVESVNPPSWVPLQGFRDNMVIIGSVKINGVKAPEGDILAAFGPGGESDCRAVADIQIYNEDINFYLTIPSNFEGEQITFKIWDSDANQVYDIAEMVLFQLNGTIYDQEFNAVAGITSATTSGFEENETIVNDTIYDQKFINAPTSLNSASTPVIPDNMLSQVNEVQLYQSVSTSDISFDSLTYIYDDLNRLKSVKYNGFRYTISYEYDHVGNIDKIIYNGYISLDNLLTILKLISGVSNENDSTMLDINCDEKINIEDAILAMIYISQ